MKKFWGKNSLVDGREVAAAPGVNGWKKGIRNRLTRENFPGPSEIDAKLISDFLGLKVSKKLPHTPKREKEEGKNSWKEKK